MSKESNQAYHDKVNCRHSEAIFQKMATKRYGVKFCCKDDLQKWGIKKELQILNDMVDPELSPVICPTPEDDPSNRCAVTCMVFNESCSLTYDQLWIFYNEGTSTETQYTNLLLMLEQYPNLQEEIQDWAPCILEPMCRETFTFCQQALSKWLNERPSTTPAEDLAVSTVVDALAKEMDNALKKIDEIDGEFGKWYGQEFDPAEVPDPYQNITITYTTCAGKVVTVPFTNQLVIYRDRTIPIVFKDPVLAESAEGGSFDMDAYMHTQFSIADVKCDCEIEGFCNTFEKYLDYPFVRVDLLHDPAVQPTDAELENLDSNFAPFQVDFDNQRDKFYNYQDDVMVSGQTNMPVTVTEEDPPTFGGPDYFSKGPENAGIVRFRIPVGCRCVGFEVNYVGKYPDIPTAEDNPGTIYDVCYIDNPGRWYGWNASLNRWDTAVYDDYRSSCLDGQDAARDGYKSALREFLLSSKNMLWAAYYIPKYQITKYLL